MNRGIRVLSLSLGLIFFSLSFSIAAAASPEVIEAAKKEGKVVIWTPSFHKAKEIFKSFRDQYPFIKVKVWDGRTSSIINKIIIEARARKYTPDIVIGSSRMFPLVHAAGLLQEYKWPNRLNKWPHQPAHGYWRLYGASVRMPTYNTKLVSPEDVPKSWEDIKNPKFKGNSIISSSGSDAPLLFAHLWRKKSGELNWERSFSFWEEVIKTTKPKVVRGFSAPLGSVSSGQYAIFLLSSSNGTLRLMRRGAPLQMASVGKTVASTWGIGIPKTIPHPNATRLLIDYFLSPSVLLHYAELNHIPLLDPDLAERAKPNVMLKESGVEWYPIPVEVRNDKNARKAALWWTTALGLRTGKRR